MLILPELMSVNFIQKLKNTLRCSLVIAGIICGFSSQAQLQPGIVANELSFKKKSIPDTFTICVSKTVTFTSNAVNAVKVDWIFENGSPSQITNNPGPLTVKFIIAGVNKVQQFVTDFTGKKDSMMVMVKVADPDPALNAGFTVEPAVPECGSKIFTFTPTIINTTKFSYSWDLGDGFESTQPTITHQFFKATGTGLRSYMVKLIVTDKSGCADTVEKKIEVKQVPDATISNSDPNITSGMFNDLTAFSYCNAANREGSFYKFKFLNNSSTILTNVKYRIIWGDGISADSLFDLWNNTDVVEHDFPFGTSTMTVQVTGPSPDACYGEKKYNIFVGFRPKASIDVESVEICVGDTAYIPISQYEDDAPGTIYFAKVSDGRDIIRFDPKIKDIVPIVFDRTSCGQSKNRWEIEFFVQNACITSSVIATVAVSDHATAAMSISPSANICLNTTLTVQNTSDYGSIITGDVASGYTCSRAAANQKFAWNIIPSDGYSITGNKGIFDGLNIVANGSSSLDIKFTKPGTYTITEYVSNTKCNVDSVQRTVCVRKNPTASFTLTEPLACNQDTVKIINTSEGDNECSGNGYKWSVNLRTDQRNCGNGLSPLYINSKDTSKSPEVWLRGAGIYDIKLITTASNTGSPACTAIKDTTLTIKAPPIVSINNITSICSGNSILPTAKVTDCFSDSALTYLWTFTNGIPETSTDSLPNSVTYTVLGTQNVKLSVENSCGLTEAVKPFDITARPTAEAGSSRSICSGRPEIIGTNTGNFTYSWSPSTGLNNPDIAQPTLTLINNNADPVKVKYYVTVSAGLNCTALDSVEIEVKQAPVVMATPVSDVVCKGNSIQLSAGGADNYTWSPATYLSSATGNIITATPDNSVTYLVTGILLNGCTDTKSINLIVGEKPIAEAGPLAGLCSGDTITIGTNTGNYHYQWSPANGLTDPEIAQPSVTLTNDTDGSYIQKYYLTVSTTLNCTTTDSVEVEVRPSPVVTVNTAAEIVCSGDSKTLIASGAATYTWSPAIYLNTANGNSVISTPVNSVLYTVTGALSNGCTDLKTINLTVVQKPIAEAGAMVQICSGSTSRLGSNSGSYTYQWYPVTGLNDPKVAEPTITLTTSNANNDTMAYYLTVSTGSVCSALDSVLVIVKPSPLVTIAPVFPEVCFGDSVIITAGGATNYTWAPPQYLNTTTANIVIAKPLLSTDYTLTGSFTNGCADTVSLTTKVNPVAVARFSPGAYENCAPYNLKDIIKVSAFTDENREYIWKIKDSNGEKTQSYPAAMPPQYLLENPGDTVAVSLIAISRYGCKNDTTGTVLFTAGKGIIASFMPDKNNVCEPADITFNNFSNLSDSSVRFSWNFGNGATSAQMQPGAQTYHTFNTYRDTFYIVSLKAMNTCTADSAKDTLYIKARPLARFGVDSTSGCSPLTLTFKNTSLGDPFDYYWNINNDSIFHTASAASFNYIFSSTVIDTFNIQLAATNGCGSDTLPLDIVVAPNSIEPRVNTFGSDLYGCPPHSVIFNNSTSGALTADWDFGDGSGIRLPGNQVVVSHEYPLPGTYKIRISFNNGCSKAVDSQQVVVYEKADAAFNILPSLNNVTCLGDSLKISLTAQTGDFNKLFWGDEGDLFYSTAGTSHFYENSGIYTIKLVAERVNNNFETVCADTAISIVKVGERPLTTKATVDSVINCFTQNAKLNVSGGVKYLWQPDLFLSPNNRVQNPIASPTASITYRVDIYGASGCVVKDSVNVVVDYSQSSYAIKLPNAFTPDNDGFNDCFGFIARGMIEKDENFELAVYNRRGQVVFHTKDPAACWDGTANGQPQDSGVYVYTVNLTSVCSGDKTKVMKDKGIVTLIR